MASRYFATVRRATLMPCSARMSASLLSDSGRRGSSAAMNFMTRCRREVREALAPFPGVDISLGVAMSEPGDTPVDVLHRADVDMYTEKRRRYQIVADDGAPGWDRPVRTDFAKPSESGPGTIESTQ